MAATWRRYLELNRSHGKPFMFHLSRRGFFSELNMLMNAVIFGLVERRTLVVREARFNDLRWGDYFATQLPQLNGFTWSDIDAASHVREKSDFFYTLLGWIRERGHDHFDIPGLDLSGGLIEVRRRLYPMFCSIQPKILSKAQMYMTSNDLVEGDFCAAHIRRGDKIAKRPKNGRMWSEGDDTPPEKYVELMRAHAPGTKHVFVLTDDYWAVEQLKDPSYGLRVSSLCPPEIGGHDQPTFNAQPVEWRRAVVERLLVETQIAAQSGFFTGGFKSNVARYVATIHSNPGRCISADSRTDLAEE